MKNKEQRLIENMKMISVELTDKQVSQFIKFYEMLVEWNKVMNLTGITEYDEVVMKHFVDSLSIVKVNGFDNETSIIDVGTGAGFPGIPLKIVDTAGIRETEDIVEKIGVQKSKESIDSADLVIIVLDSSKPLTDEDLEILENARSKKTIVLLNKIDLEQAIDQTLIEEIVGKENIIKISALKNEGIEKIHDKIEAMVFAGDVKSSSSVVITNSRHKDALFKAYNSINDAIAGIDQRLPYDFIEVDFKNIWDYLGYINGDTVQEDLLDTIFSNFCIGK